MKKHKEGQGEEEDGCEIPQPPFLFQKFFPVHTDNMDAEQGQKKVVEKHFHDRRAAGDQNAAGQFFGKGAERAEEGKQVSAGT